jgi:hypothetical protein
MTLLANMSLEGIGSVPGGRWRHERHHPRGLHRVSAPPNPERRADHGYGQPQCSQAKEGERVDRRAGLQATVSANLLAGLQPH